MDIEKLEKLNELKEKGILTEEEFNIQKKSYYLIMNNHKMCLKNKMNNHKMCIKNKTYLCGTILLNV